MKKFLSGVIITMIFMFIGMVKVNAAIDISIKGNDKIELNKNVDVTFTISGYSDKTGKGTISIDYPSNLLRCNSNCPKTKEITENTSFTYQFTAIGNGEALINVYNYNGKDASHKIVVGSVTKPPSSSQPSTTVPTTQAPQEIPKSNNANLKTLIIKADDDSDVILTPEFNSGVYEYSATVASTIKTVAVNAILEDAKSNIIISNNANEELKAGENNKITITVTAEDGTKKAYTLNIKREALTGDATLKELTIDEVDGFTLEEDKFTYNIKVKKSIKELTISYVLSDENASVEIEGNKNLKDGSKVKITVTAEDGTKKVYTLNISKITDTTKEKKFNIKTEKNPLIIMGLSIVAFGLIGGIIYVIKK